MSFISGGAVSKRYLYLVITKMGNLQRGFTFLARIVKDTPCDTYLVRSDNHLVQPYEVDTNDSLASYSVKNDIIPE